MTRPDDAFAPPGGRFAEPWHAEVLALARAMQEEGRFTAEDWATTLGAALAEAGRDDAPDTEETYFTAALVALECLSETAGIPASARSRRRTEWEDAYRRTPHGMPVRLDGSV